MALNLNSLTSLAGFPAVLKLIYCREAILKQSYAER